jgi:DNA processing protein
MHTVRYALLQKHLVFAPVPQGQHAQEPQSRGVLALSQQTGAELARDLHADGEYRTLLKTTFASVSPAVPLRTRQDYDVLIAELNQSSDRYDRPARGPAQASLF